ncbi:MAG: GyrI-like domain-containing protein [Eubacteriales bacterium]
MPYQIEVKNVPSIPVLTHIGTVPATTMEVVAFDLHFKAEASNEDSLFCISRYATLDEETEVKLCCPIHSVDLEIDTSKYKIEVLPRCLVLSTIHNGKYNELKDVFKAMNEYIIKNNLTTALPYRMIYHREKRHKERPHLHKIHENEYVTEIQIQILDK